MVAQSVKSEAHLSVGDIVEETGAIYAGTLPVTEDRSQKTGIFVVLPPWDDLAADFNSLYGKDHPSGETLVTDFGSLYRLAGIFNSAVYRKERESRRNENKVNKVNNGNNGNNGKPFQLVEIPSLEEVKIIIGNRHKGELATMFNEHGLNSGSFTKGYIWTSTPGEVIGEPKKIEGNKTVVPISHTMHKINPVTEDVFDDRKWVPASGFLTYRHSV